MTLKNNSITIYVGMSHSALKKSDVCGIFYAKTYAIPVGTLLNLMILRCYQ